MYTHLELRQRPDNKGCGYPCDWEDEGSECNTKPPMTPTNECLPVYQRKGCDYYYLFSSAMNSRVVYMGKRDSIYNKTKTCNRYWTRHCPSDGVWYCRWCSVGDMQ